MTLEYAKKCFSVKNLILTSERRAEHPLAGRNTQQIITLKKCVGKTTHLIFLKQKSMLVFIALQIPGNVAFLIEEVKENIALDQVTFVLTNLSVQIFFISLLGKMLHFVIVRMHQ